MEKQFKGKLIDAKQLEPRGVELTFDRECINGDAKPMVFTSYVSNEEATKFTIGESYDLNTIFPTAK